VTALVPLTSEAAVGGVDVVGSSVFTDDEAELALVEGGADTGPAAASCSCVPSDGEITPFSVDGGATLAAAVVVGACFGATA
jgi:hypothetical protein